MTELPNPPAVRPKIFIATPTHDHKFHASFAFSLLRLQAARLFPLHITKVGGAGVARARNNQAQEFYVNTDCDYFFPIDGDIEFTPEQFARIVNHGLLNCAGLYCNKSEELQWCINALPNEGPDKNGVQKVAKTGTGFKCIHRSVFTRIIEAHPEIAYIDDLTEAKGVVRWDFFSMGVVGPNSFEARAKEIGKLVAEDASPLAAAIREILAAKHAPGRYLTEDWYYDHRCAELNPPVPVHVDVTFHLKHEGLIAYPIKSPFDSMPRWHPEFLAEGIAPDHCADVLDGCYDVAFDSSAPPIILDIGANIGAFASWATARWPKCTIHAYEPDPKNFAMLEKTASAIRAETESVIHCHRSAVLDRDAAMPLFRGAHNCGEHSLFDVGEQTKESVLVQVIAAMSLPVADVLKLDTEGSEMPILSALNDAGRLGEFSAILLEYHSEADRDAIVALLKLAGFVAVGARARCPGRGELKFVNARAKRIREEEMAVEPAENFK